MTVESRHAACERARVWASLLPDGELSLFERRLLDAHCAHCVDCRRVLDSVGSVTEMVRATPLEVMERRVRVLRARPSYWRSASGVLATGGAAVFALVLASWVGPQRAHPGRSATLTAPVIVFTPQSSTRDTAAIWELKRTRGGTIATESAHGHRTGPVL